MRSLLVLLVSLATAAALAQPGQKDVFGTSSCMGCHGQSAMGGLGPPIAKTKLSYERFEKVVREGKGMMPATPPAQMSDAEVKRVYDEVLAMTWKPSQIPVAFKVGQMLSTKNVSTIFMFVFGISTLCSLYVLYRWLSNAGLGRLWPYLRKMGLARSAWIAVRSLVVDGLCVRSLWERDRFRWAMHGLLLYGMFGLLLADILLQIFNPNRSDLPLGNPLKILPMLSGMAVMSGVFYVMYRYRKDRYVDNGLTLGKDFLFVNLLLHTVISGFLTVWINRTEAYQWVMPIYLYHLGAISVLILTAPFTRFQHAFVVPALVMVTRLTEAVAASGVDLGFEREPSPGRHHKSQRLAQDLATQLDPGFSGEVRLRYYP